MTPLGWAIIVAALIATGLLTIAWDWRHDRRQRNRLSAEQVGAMVAAARDDLLGVLDRHPDDAAGLADVCRRSRP